MWNLLVKNKRYQLVENYQLGPCDKFIVANDLLSLIEVESSTELVGFSQIKLPNSQVEKSLLDLFGKLFSFMPNGQENIEHLLPDVFWPSGAKFEQEVTFFGGSFNPWHEGHKECLRQCSKIEDFIVVVPDYSPWKENSQEGALETLASLAKRIDNEFPIYPGFWALDSQEQRNPTASWLKHVNAKRINWLMGDDTFYNFLKWDRVEEVVTKLKKIYVVPRDHDQSELKAIESQLLEFNSELRVIYLESHPYQDLSSTKLR